jgi:4-carboxymuconolactone decarboxylase
MARIPLLTNKEDVSEDKQHIVEEIMGSRGGRISGPFSVLLHNPEAAGRSAHLGSALRFESTLPDDLREVAINTAARENDCGYEWAGHAKLALSLGVSQETLDVIANRQPLDSLSKDEALVVQYGRELFRDHRISDATYAAASERFGTRGLVDLTALMGYYGMLACSLNAFDVQPPADGPQLP